MLKKFENLFSKTQKLLDILILLFSWLFAYYIRFNFFKGSQSDLEFFFLCLAPFVCIITYWNIYKEGLYYSQRLNSLYSELLKTFKANLKSVVYIVLIFYFFLDNRVSRSTIVLYWGVSTFLLVFSKGAIRIYLKSLRIHDRNLRHIVLVGNNPTLLNYIEKIKNYKESGLKIRSWYDSDNFAKEHGYNDKLAKGDLYVMSYLNDDKHKEQEFLKKHYSDVTPIIIIPDLSYSLIGHKIEDFWGIPLVTYNKPTFNPLELFLKDVIDRIVVLIGLIAISPLFVLIAILVKLTSKGPIFYGQERITQDGRTFKMWKFRTMTVAKNGEDKEEWQSKNNVRITKIGNILRRSSLDEIPQFLNILFGEMSLVGPRPERTHFVDKFKNEIPNYMLRHKMKAGLTGWAQVNGLRGDTSLVDRVEYDLYYIKNWSIWFDVKIILLTFVKGFINKNAY